MSIQSVAIIGLGLIGGSTGLAVRSMLPQVETTGWDADPDVRRRAAERGLVAKVCDTAGEAVANADLVIFCVPVGAMEEAARAIAPDLRDGAIVSDVGSSKASVAAALARALPRATIIPAHPVAGTENSGPDAGFAELFRHRWCILTPPQGARRQPWQTFQNSGRGWAQRWRLWSPSIMIWCWPSPAISPT